MDTKRYLAAACAGALAWGLASAASAGPVFLTGHDPDFHTQSRTC